MKSKIIRTLIAITLSVVMCSSLSISTYAKSAVAANIKSKTEVLYGNLEADGNVNSIYAVNQFAIETGGVITDFGDYSSVLNLTTTNNIEQNNDAVTFSADKGNFYYQGNLTSTSLPWILSFTYTLDGQSISPDHLAGKSGDLIIHFTTRKNPSVNAVFYENYMLQAAFRFDNDSVSDIDAKGAAIASAGMNTSVNFTVMPKQDADATISATVTNFHMDSVQISGIPLSVNVDFSDTDDMVGNFSQLTDAIRDLNDGVTKLDGGAKNLSDNASKLTNGSSKIQDALTQLSNNSSQITSASQTINQALSQVASSLTQPSSSLDFSSISTLTQSLSQMADGLHSVSSGLTTLNTGFQSSYEALDQAIRTIPDTALTPEQIKALYQIVASSDSSQTASLDVLVNAYQSALTTKGTYSSVRKGFDAVGTTIETITPTLTKMETGLREIASQMETSLSETDVLSQLSILSTAMSKLSSNYTSFHNGLLSYMSGVSSLSDNYSDFQSGLSQYKDGMHTFQNGVAKLQVGTETLQSETKDFPTQIQDTIDEMSAQYSGDDYEPVSFLSLNNKKISLVQFVMKTEAITIPPKTEAPIEDTTHETFWDRLIQLFTKK
ncbi:MAG: hypothetical protein ACERKN_06620 [Velocimicrobium sp.]